MGVEDLKKLDVETLAKHAQEGWDLANTRARELTAARETISAMNRRCQAAESAAATKVEEVLRAGPSLGRGLANWAASEKERKVKALELQVGELQKLQLSDTQITLNQEIDRLRDIAEDHRLLKLHAADLERQLTEERKRCAEIASYYNDPKKIEELILSGAAAGEWKGWRKKMQQQLQPPYLGHCYVGHCSYFVDRRCICLCSKCDEAKKADH